MKRFRVVPMDEAQEGMRLHEELRDRAGNVLLPALTALTGTMIKSLLRRDVEALLIVDDTITPEQLAAERRRVQERFDYLYRHTESGRADVLVRKVVEEYRMEELS